MTADGRLERGKENHKRSRFPDNQETIDYVKTLKTKETKEQKKVREAEEKALNDHMDELVEEDLSLTHGDRR